MLLQKTMVTVEGVARSFDPKVNIWDASEDLVADWLRRQIGPQAVLKDIKQNAQRGLAALKRLPDTLEQAERSAAALEQLSRAPAAPKSDRLARGLGLAALATALISLSAVLARIWL